MSVTVRIPTVLRKYTDGQSSLEAEGGSVREVIEDLVRRHPGLRDQVVSADGQLHRFINLYVNDEDVRYLEGVETKVSPGDVVAILPAVAGGRGRGPAASASGGAAPSASPGPAAPPFGGPAGAASRCARGAGPSGGAGGG